MAHLLETCDLDTYANAHGNYEWENYMVEEYCSLMNNYTWNLAPQLQGNNVVKCRLVYKRKITFKGIVERHKDRLGLRYFLKNH
jgi:hypothetical protein